MRIQVDSPAGAYRAKAAFVSDEPSVAPQIDLRELRRKVSACLEQNLHKTAAFLADKLVALSDGMNDDVYLLARSYFMGREFRRAIHLLDSRGLLTLSPEGVLGEGVILKYIHLATQCWIANGQHDEAHEYLERLLGTITDDGDLEAVVKRRELFCEAPTQQRADGVSMYASLCAYKGRVHELLENRARAVQWYRAALYCDVHCFMALDALIDNQLEPEKEHSLIEELSNQGSFSDASTKWILEVYKSRLGNHDHRTSADERFRVVDAIASVGTIAETGRSTASCTPETLASSLDCVVTKAQCRYYQYDSHGALKLTQWVRARDPYHMRCIGIHIASLVELNKKSDLFYCAHQLVEAYPKEAIAWFAVGCYYYASRKYDAARRHFHRATTLDPRSASSWLAFGHAFAVQEESDQAMAAYRTASRLFIGCHIPVLCTATEYLRTNNVTLAKQFCLRAQRMCGVDPMVLNELGVAHYRQGMNAEAIKCFRDAFALCQKQSPQLNSVWEPIVNNLGHACRKEGMYEDAISYYNMALGFSPREASTYAALGFTYHLQGNVMEAVENYHKALGLKPEDTFCFDLLNRALKESYGEGGYVDPAAIDRMDSQTDTVEIEDCWSP